MGRVTKMVNTVQGLSISGLLAFRRNLSQFARSPEGDGFSALSFGR